MKKLLVLLIFVLPLLAFGQNVSVNSIDYFPYTVSTLPTASTNIGRTFLVTDGTSGTDCTAGGGSSYAFCRSNGSYFAVAGGTPIWSGLTAPTANLSLNGYQTVLSPFTTVFTAGDFGVSPLTTIGAINFTDASTSTTDITPDLSCAVPTTSWHDCFLGTIDGFKQFSIYAHGSGHVGEVAIGSAIDTHSLNTAAYDSKFWVMSSSHPVNMTLYAGQSPYTGTVLKIESHSAASSAWNGLAICGTASNADASCITNSFTIDGLGDVTINGAPVGSYVKADGSGYGTPSGTGTVTSIGLTQTGTVFTITGSPVTTAGSINIALNGPLPVANGGTGTTTPGLVAGTNITITGSWPNQTINSTGGGGGGSPNYEQAFTSQTSITMLGTSHGFGVKDLLLDCYDTSSPAQHFQPANWTIDSSTFNVVVNFANSQSGYCVLNGSGGGGGGGGTTRTWAYSFQGVCQAGVASAAVNFPVTNSPSYVVCDATHITPEWQIPATNTTDTFWVRLTVPTGHTGAYTLTTKYRSAATSGTATVQPKYACVAGGNVPDNPTFSNAGSTFTLTPAGTTLQNVITTDTFTPTCADGADLYVMYTFTANSVGSPINFSYVSLSVTGNL